MELANESCDVVKEWKPAHPIKELSFANLADLRRETFGGREQLPKERQDSHLFGRCRSFQSRIALFYGKDGHQDGTTHGETGNNG